MEMKQINVGGMHASNVALGIMRMDALSDEKAAEVIDAAVDAGINYIDSADLYGHGASSAKFKAGLKLAKASRDELYIQSKGGIVSENDGDIPYGNRYNFSKQHLIAAVDGELQRLGVDYLDSFLLHRPDPLMEPAEIAEAFDELQTAGKVRHFGVSNFNPMQIELLQKYLQQKLIINQLQFGIMHTGMIDFGMHTNMTDDRSVNHDGQILEYSRIHDMTIQAWSPYQYGFFDGVFIDNPKFPELNKKMQEIADIYGVTKNAIATAWILRHPAQFQVLLGTMNPQRIKESAAGSDVELTGQEWYDIYYAAGNDLP
ncbi:aldo keto reductase family oxidoreductase [Pediococcus acidilactici]|uniref:Oxidoreductase, aldo/keto reductase family protein n=2 Tax=Lactobacillaceae TaxID=33958 RepID=E0NIF0_PEDAC|nr:oxidoreductase, aldo/keto reductase family protein [Pediococcus acidilactici DSM 20284]KRN15711.1 aldo keto reductase family oxidoreductase [Pediococcus acidilactici]